MLKWAGASALRRGFCSGRPLEGPSLGDFLAAANVSKLENMETTAPAPYLADHTPGVGRCALEPPPLPPRSSTCRKIMIETYGCQMNFSDTEIINSVLRTAGFESTSDENEADVVLLNTCAIRENAEGKVWGRLSRTFIAPSIYSLTPLQSSAPSRNGQRRK